MMINLAPLIEAPLAVQIHALSALPALVLGPIALFRKSRDGLHRWAGRLWVAAMLALSLSSFFIFSIRMIGPFSPIHLLSILTLAGLWRSFGHLRRGAYEAHGRAMRAIYLQALILAGIFTFLPGRRMSQIFFADQPQAGLALIAALGLALALLILAFPRLSGLSRPRPPWASFGQAKDPG